jgi:biopolymer transport protein ExbD
VNRLGNIKRNNPDIEGIDIGPLIDIIFILLIFFMVSTTFVRNFEVGIQRPSAYSAQVSDVRAIRIAIQRDGHVWIDGQTVQTWMVQSRVRELLALNPRRPVLITADRRLEAGQLIEIVDQCRMAGAKDVAVDTNKSS